ncbi:MAG: sulfite exporter TauE/SafE family protein [Candidatus Hydrothermarchaeales archaeon]
MEILILIFILGITHGFDIDHLAAITALASRGASNLETATLGFSFGFGHMMTLLIFGIIGLLTGLVIPPSFERGAEIFGGLLLIVIGGIILYELAQKKVYIHQHSHRHPEEPHTHFHLHVNQPHPQKHKHAHQATLVGGLFAFSGLRNLLIMVPIVLATNIWEGSFYILIFGIGVIISMSLYGLVIGKFIYITRDSILIHRLTSILTALISLGLGIYWIGVRL